MSSALDDLFDVEAAIAEGGLSLGTGLRKQPLELRHILSNANAPSAPAGSGLDHDRKADLGDDVLCGFQIGDQTVATWDGQHTGTLGDPARGYLVPHQSDRVAARADEGQASRGDPVGKGRILRQETVAGMNGVGTALPGGGQQSLDIEIGLRRRRGTDLDGFVGQLHRQGVGIGGAVNLNGRNALFPGRADDPHGDLTPIGDQQFANRHSPGVPRLSL